MSGRLLITPDGDAFEPASNVLARRHGVGCSDIDLHDYSVRNLGYIGIQSDGGRLWISARPQLVSQKAVNGAAAVTRAWPCARVVLRLFDGVWQTTIFATPADAIARLRQLAREQSNHPDWSSFVARSIRLNQLKGRAYDGMHLLAGEWALLDGRMDDAMHLEFLQRKMPSNTMLAHKSEDRQGIVVAHGWIAGCPPAAAWMRRASGRDLREHEDQVYAAWVMPTYHEVLDRNEPRLEAVEATLRCPQFGSRSFYYDRLILPWTRPCGETVATLVSVVRDMTAAAAIS